MAYTKTVYQDGVTPITASTLNNVENFLEYIDAVIGTTGNSGATYSLHDVDIRTDYGFGIYSTYDDTCRIVFDSRTGDIKIKGNVYLTNIVGESSSEVIWLGTGNCGVDMAGGDSRWKRDAYNYISQDANAIYFYMGGAIKHQFNLNGTKSGGSIEIEGVNYGLSPTDCPQVLIEDVLFDIDVEETGTIITLDSRLSKALSKYAVFPSVGSCVISDKTQISFKVSGYTGKVDLNIKGKRIDSTEVNWKIL